MLEVLLKTLVALGLLAVGAAYARGWRRLRAARDAAPRWRLALYAAGLATIAGALLSPLDALAAERFSAHMGQHLLLTMVAAPLVVLGNPLPFVLWGAPAGTPQRTSGSGLPRTRSGAATIVRSRCWPMWAEKRSAARASRGERSAAPIVARPST